MQRQKILIACLLGVLTSCSAAASPTAPAGGSPAAIAAVSTLPTGPDATQTALAQAINALFTQTAVAVQAAANSTRIPPSPMPPTLTPDPEQDPPYVTRTWITGFFGGQGAVLARYTCQTMAKDVSDASQLTGLAMGGLAGLLNGVTRSDSIQIDMSHTDFSLVQNSGSRAVVHMSGEAYLTVAGGFKTLPVNGNVNLVYEDARWKVCDLVKTQ